MVCLACDLFLLLSHCIISNADTVLTCLAEQGYSIFVKNLPYHANIEMVEEEFKKFGTIKPGGVQVRHNKVTTFRFGFFYMQYLV